MALEDFKLILQWHPELILTSEDPPTWRGFILVPYKSNAIQNLRVHLKLSFPNYPSSQGVKLNFGKRFPFMLNIEFNKQITTLLEKPSTVYNFLRQLQSLIRNFNDTECDQNSIQSENLNQDILAELKLTLNTSSEVKLLSTRYNVNEIKLSMDNVFVTLKRINDRIAPWMVVSSDLPEIPGFEGFEKNICTLNEARDKFQQLVEISKPTWDYFKEIDRNCWIIDPIRPKLYDLYRRIALTPSLSILITIDPLNIENLPGIKFLGSTIEVEKHKNIISKNYKKWNSNRGIIDNLLTLLDLEKFPQKPKDKDNPTTEETNGIIADEECCICFELKMNDETFPNQICDNKKCRRHFHVTCLLQWLQAVGENKVVFGHINGTCPHCEEPISCNIV